MAMAWIGTAKTSATLEGGHFTQGCSQMYFFTEALAEFQQYCMMIVQI